MTERAKKEKHPLRESKNYQEQYLKVVKLYKQATARNEDFQHVLSKRLTESQGRIFAEGLDIKGLMHDNFLRHR